MTNRTRTAALLAAFLPWALSLNYMFKAWTTSPMDRYDWIFILAFIPLFIYTVRRKNEPFANSGVNWISYYGSVSSLLTVVAGIVFSVHLLYIVGTLGLAWSGCRFILGKAKGKALLCPFLVLALSTTSSTYWLSIITGWPPAQAFQAKMTMGLVFAALSFLTFKFRLEPVLFIFACAGSLLLCYQTEVLIQKMPPLMPDFNIGKNTLRETVGRELSLTEDMKRYYGETTAQRFLYATQNRTFQVLNVTCGDDIHKIHAASHCLRGSAADILSETTQAYHLRKKTVMLQEILVRKNFKYELHVIWYSNENFSVNNYLAFRNQWKKAAHWHIYQIATTVTLETISQARHDIERLIDTTPEIKMNETAKHLAGIGQSNDRTPTTGQQPKPTEQTGKTTPKRTHTTRIPLP